MPDGFTICLDRTCVQAAIFNFKSKISCFRENEESSYTHNRECNSKCKFRKKKSNINDTVKCTFSETKQQSKVELADNDSTIGNLIRRYKLDTIFKQIKSIKDNTRGKE